ncbi:serine/threonine-protein kinase [Leptothoe sp. PORK10 BA2]|uniref:serine/threonine-protein kinase n=1 Tax=Leptothoe sp. PORK10 BA2 TaxID=3110254 RepID=UPI002B1F1B28|nr:serine/threonine-protein kinase [Leptothoe sp. PORK10 BA2]MEA5464357.1 serine/threonine-protein kinase [Leptothoe sp. PORK10 BA2]
MSDPNSQDRQDSRLSQKLCDSGQLFRDRYEVVRVLGRGGFGVTHLARDRMLPGSPLCVIKQLFPKVSHPIALERAKQRFRREARILGRLGSHSQLPMLLDYFTFQGEFFLVQEYIHGDTLSREVRKGGAQKEPVVKKFLAEVLPAVRYIHRNRVIHRDIKPPNIIRCRDDNRLVLLDFGAVRECLHHDDDPGDHAASPTTHFVGTMGFAPPEQLALRPTYSSDIYALGVTCLYLLSGKSPLEFDIDPETQELDWQRSVSISQSFERLLSKMLTTDLSARFKRIDEVQRALQLEEHYSNLERCLNRVPRAAEAANPEDVELEQNLSPIQRRAAAIRSLRQRQQQHSRGSSGQGPVFPL